jgi:hypothetical protein
LANKNRKEPRNILAQYWNEFQVPLFSYLSQVIEEPITPKIAQLVSVWDVVAVEQFVLNPFGPWSVGRPVHDRRCLARAFVAKAVYDLTTTEALIELLKTNKAVRRLCGFESVRGIPSSATFSRVFAEFTKACLGDKVHAALVEKYVGEQTVMHESVDSTEVPARERAAAKKEKVAKEKRKRGRPKKGEPVLPKETKRLDIQLKQTVDEALGGLSKVCDWGTKKDTGGHKHTWKGYKAHIAWADDNIPLGMVTTSASVHDSQVAIPLIRLVANRVASCYVLGDSAYDAPQIRKAIEALGQKAIIDPNPRGTGVPEEKLFDPATRSRYNERTTAERGNSRLKDSFGFRHVRVRGNPKVHLHLMFGLVALFADQLLKPCTG